MAQIFFNGKMYNDIAEMPATERQAYEQMMGMFVDKNGNGIPDFLEGDIVKNVSSIYSGMKSIQFDGKTYNNMNELPAEVQDKVKNAMKKMIGVGVIPQGAYEEHASKHNVHNESHIKSSPFISREYNPVIQEDKKSNIFVLLLLGVLGVLCLGIAVFIMMLAYL